MDLVHLDTAIRVWVVVALVAGVAAITLSTSPLVTTAGVVLVVLGLVSLMAVVRNGMVDERPA